MPSATKVLVADVPEMDEKLREFAPLGLALKWHGLQHLITKTPKMVA